MEEHRAGESSSLLLTYVAENEFFRALDPAVLADLEGDLELVTLDEGETLFQQGDPGDSMYILVRGLLHIRASNPDGGETVLDILDPGASVGEMALLTGQARTATADSLQGAELVKISKVAFDRFAEKHPQVLAAFAQTITPRWQRAQLVGAVRDVFGDLDVSALHDLQAALEWQHLRSGDVLFHQGEPADAIYIVVSGRLRVVAGRDGNERVIDEAGRGESVGEFALLASELRSATVYAIRDTEVVKLSQDVFERLLQHYPRAMLHVARTSVRRIQRTLRFSSLESTTAATFAVVPAGSGAAPAGFAVRLAETLAEHGPTLHLSSERFDAAYGKVDAAQTEENDPTNLVVTGWLSDQEASHRYVIYETDATWSPWTQRCLRQADRVVLVGQAGRAAVPGEIEAAMRRAEPRARMELVLVQPDGNSRPTGAAAWLAERRVAAHHHLRMSSADDFQRLARRLAGRAVGLVFSGGGARGFAQIGAIRALEEAGLRADLVGGTSIGALVAAMYVMGADYAHLHKLAEALASPKRLLDRTLPLASFMASAKVTSVYRRIFDDAHIEDLWRPYFCVSTNLTRAEPVVHEQGLLWEAVRASTAIPGIFAPFLYKGDVVVDGGVMNHFPVDLMRERCEGGMLIAVNTSPRTEKLRNYQFGPSISGWQVLRSRLNPLERTVRVPSIFSTLTRATEVGSVYRLPFQEELADLLIRPPVEQFRTLDFGAYAEIIDTGYHAAREQIEAWQQEHASVGS